MKSYLISKSKRCTLPSSFVNSTVTAFTEKERYRNQYSTDGYEEDEDTITNSMTSSPITDQRSSPPQPTATTSLDHLWSKQERYNNLELRLFALEEAESLFESRLQLLETNKPKQKNIMKPDQPLNELGQGNDIYMRLYHALLQKYDALQLELEKKEEFYKDRIQELTSQIPKRDNVPSTGISQSKETPYREEDGYLLFDSTNMKGEITQCRIKIPTKPETQASMNYSTSTCFTGIRPQQLIPRYVTSPKRSVNPSVSEMTRRDLLFYHK